MDPSGPWAYTYNRIAVTGVSSPSATTASSDYQQQHNLTTAVAGQAVVSGSPPTSSTILLQTSNPSDVGGNSGNSYNSGGYITSTPVSYEQVFNPIFQHSSAKPAQYNSSINSHRQNLGSVQVVSTPEKAESPQQNFANHGQQQQQNFYTEQNSSTSPSPSTSLVSGTTLTWRSGNVSHIAVGDPFSILSQDNVVQAASPVSSGQSNSYGTQYQTQQSQLSQIKVNTRSSSPQVVGGAKTTIQSVPSPIAAVTVASSGMQASAQYYRQSGSITPSYSDSSAQSGSVNSSKSFSTVNPSLNQTCILLTTSPVTQGVSAQNITNQKYAKKQNMYNATRNSGGKSGAVIGQQNLIVTNNGNNSNFNSPTAKSNNHTLQLVQTKAQNKIYPELVFVDEQERAKFAEIHQTEGQDGTVSYYTILDGRLAYATPANTNLIINESPKGRTIANIQSPRQFVLSNTASIIAPDGSTIKTEPDYSVSALQNECATNTIIVPRKQSPSHSTSSQAASPAYPIYNSPMNSIESPSQQSASSGATHSSSENSGHIVIYKSNTPNQAQIATQSALDNSANSRVTANSTLTNSSGPVVYSSVITRALVNEPGKVYNPQQTCWDNEVKPKKYFTINSGGQNEIVVPADIQLKPAYYDPSVNSAQLGALHGLKTEEPQVTENILVTSDNPLSSQLQLAQKLEEPPQSSTVSVQQQQPPQPQPPVKTRRRRNQNSTKTREQLLSENEFLINRVTPVTHEGKGGAIVQQEMPGNVTLQQVQVTQTLPEQQHNGGSYYENRWNANQQSIVGGTSGISNQIQNYNSSQHLQSQHQQQQSQQQTVLTHQPSQQFNPQSAYYSSYQISPSAPNHILQTSTAETSTSSAEAQAQSMLESGAQILSQLASSSEAVTALKEDSAPSTLVVNPDDPSLKVVVPNIEEELEFLSTEPVKVNKSKNSVTAINPVLKITPRAEPMQGRTFKMPNSAATGFMASYLKFLQGDRDGSPPPLGRAQRKTLYQKAIQSTATGVINSGHMTSSKSLPAATVQSNKTVEQSGSSAPLSINQQSVISTGKALSTNRNQQQNRTPLHQVTSSVSQEQPLLASALTVAPNSSITLTTNYAATQTVNKKRKAVALATENDQNKKKTNYNKPKNISELAVQTTSHPVMLPKKARPQMAMQMASMQQSQHQQINVQKSEPSIVIKQEPTSTIIATPVSVSQSQDSFTYRYLQKQVHQPPPQASIGSQQQQQAPKQIQQQSDEDPLNLPPRREPSCRKAKTRGIEEIMQKKFENDDAEEPQEFVDSDADPVWTPEDEENELNKSGKSIKRKGKRPKVSYSRSRKAFSNILTAAVMGAGIDDSDADNNAAAATAAGFTTTCETKVQSTDGVMVENPRRQILFPKGLKQEAIKQEASPTVVNATKLLGDFKTGDFVILRTDLVKDWPVLWQVDGKLILQMFEPFDKDGQIMYKNMSKYAAWNNESKRLYVRAPVNIRSQIQNEFIVELNKSELYGSDIEQFAQKLLVEYLKYRENFDVYIQTLISQSLDGNFFTEITKEKDEYFLSNIKIIDDIMENCKKKLQLITPLSKDIIDSLETWPHFNVIVNSAPSGRGPHLVCSGCRYGGYIRFLLYGQPYNPVTLVSVEPDQNANFEKDIIFCQSCESRVERLHKVTHEKYNLYQICLRKVQEQQLVDSTKGTTAILNDLLADSEWIDQLFANVRNAWTEVECLDKIVRFYQVSQ